MHKQGYRDQDQELSNESLRGELQTLTDTITKLKARKPFKMTVEKLSVIGWSNFFLFGLMSAQFENIGWTPYSVWCGIFAAAMIFMAVISTVSHFSDD